MLTVVTTLAGITGILGIAVALVVLGLLSQRLGAVTRQRPYHRGLYIAAGLTLVSALSRGMALSIQDERITLVYTTTLALGSTLGLVVAWRYWDWLFGER